MRLQINNFYIFSNNIGFRLSSECKLESFGKFDIKGLAVFNNYLKAKDLITNYFFNLGRFKTFSENSRITYKEATRCYFRSMSDHPNSNLDGTIFGYK
jgi:hypothetical protein